jgi:hypothetical protein
MAYLPDLTWTDLVRNCEIACRNEMNTREESLRQYDLWQRFRAGRTNAQIATALSKTETEIGEMDAAFAVFKTIHDFANNVASPTQGDRYYSLRQFLG